MGKNVLQLHASSGCYGGEAVILSLSKAMKGTCYNSIVGCLASKKKTPELGRRARMLGLDSVYFPMKVKGDPYVISEICNVVRDRNVRIIHAHGYKSNLLGLFVSKLYHIPIITTNHLFPPMPMDDWKLQLYSKFDAWFTMRHLDRIVAVSEEIKSKLVKKGLKGSHVVTIENGIDLDEFGEVSSIDRMALKKNLGIPSDSFVVGSLGRLTPQKGYTYLLESAKKVVSRNSDAVFVIAGDGPLKNYLKQYSETLGIQEKVRFLGFREDVLDVLRMMDIFVLSSIDEGLPMAMLEAMAARTPVVVTSVGDIGKVIKSRINGCLVEARDAAMLAEEIEYLINNKSVRDSLCKNALETVCRDHSKEAMCDKYVSIYEEVLAEYMMQ